MAYVNVTVIDPNGQEYDAEIDENADEQALLSTLIEMLDLPHVTEDGRTIEYRLNLIGAVKIKEDVIIKIEKVGPPLVRSLRPRGTD